jgi:hypothetical protein
MFYQLLYPCLRPFKQTRRIKQSQLVEAIFFLSSLPQKNYVAMFNYNKGVLVHQVISLDFE